MRKYDTIKQPPNYFMQGFWLGLTFGVLGAIVILGRDNSPEETLGEATPAEITETVGETVAEEITPETPENPPLPIAQG
jgi:hypothetical protein